jgi:hypothetical protein
MMTFGQRFYRFLVGIDQALNPMIFGGSENVTLSSQCAYNELCKGKHIRTRKVIDFIFLKLFSEKNHCYESLIDEVGEFYNSEEVLFLLAEKGVMR